MHILGVLFFTLFFVAAPAFASDIKVIVAEVKDQRSTGEFFNNLEMKLRLIGDDSASVRGIKTSISRAVDDTGRNLLLADEKKDRFETVSDGTGKAEVNLKFRNPARKAAVVKEITGKLHLFMPDKDPSATLLIDNFMNTGGRPISDPALSKAGITVTVLTKKEYESLRKEEENKAKEAAQMQGVAKAIISAFEGLFSGFFQVGDNDLLFKITDPSGNLIEMDVIDPAGAKINSHGNMKSHDLLVLNYSEAVPAEARLRLFLKTQKSVISIPLRLVDVALP